MSKICIYALSLTLLACGGTPLTPELIQRHGARELYGHKMERSFKASAAALRTLGYQITQESVEAWALKTAPKVLNVSSESTHKKEQNILALNETKTETVVTKIELSWMVKLAETESGVLVRLTPRGYVNGVERPIQYLFSLEGILPHFEQLWREIDDSLQMIPAKSKG